MGAKEDDVSGKEEKAKPDRSPDRRNYLSALARDVPALTKLALGKRGFAEADLVGRWAEIVGPETARLALPVKLRLPRPKSEAAKGAVAPNVAGGTLTLRCSPAASLELQHLKPRILERITTYFGYPAIREIRLEIGDRKRPKPVRRSSGPATPPDLSRVTDPELREALQRLGAARQRRG